MTHCNTVESLQRDTSRFPVN